MEKFAIPIALAGGFGGVAPSLVDLAKRLHGGEILRWFAGLGPDEGALIPALLIVAGSAIYFIIGAAVASFSKESNLLKAMMLGIGAPALIMATVQGTGSPPTPTRVEASAGRFPFALVRPAFAQDGTDPAGDRMTVVIDQGIGQSCPNCSISVFDEKGQLIEMKPISGPDASQQVVVPDTAKSLVITGADTNSTTIDVDSLKQDGAQQPVTLERNRSYWNDVQRSFGNRSAQPFNFQVRQ